MAEQTIKNFYLTPSPHFSSGETTQNIMLTVIAALVPLSGYGVYLFGIPALVRILVSVASCVIFESLFRLISRRDIRLFDFSAVVTGLLLALVCPPSLPLWMLILGALFGIVVAKEFFGGLGANVFNPALSGRALLFVSFPAAMATWTVPFDTVSGATALSQIKAGEFASDIGTYLTYFLGKRGGCIGETSALLILLAFVFLLATKIIDWRAPVTMIVTTAAATALSGGDPLMAMLSGGLLFGAVFMTTDYATSPVTTGGRYIFGFGCGLITFLIRRFGGYPEGVMFSILIMNMLVPFLNNIIPHKYGWVKPKKTGATK
ncbi:MAG: RnfABCDGE type electron transport complex subunit D [Treponema sp.]|jgi:electron transport complex protein RnfD|nr:RnfABCDGE type electron transport complex subunit D [Treponema sp.]